jgi:hypothetical protein
MLSGDRLVALDGGQQTVLLLFQRGNSGALETPAASCRVTTAAVRCTWRLRLTPSILQRGRRA